MNTNNEQITDESILPDAKNVRTLEGDILSFTENLPYFAQYLSEQILAGNLDESHYQGAYNYLLEDADILQSDGKRPSLNIICKNNSGEYHQNLSLKVITGVQGINALVPGQALEVCPNLTIVYGSNGSGKSGYIRLMNNVFITKGEKTILPNVHEDNPDAQKAEFQFMTNAGLQNLAFPTDCSAIAFKQFSVFDEKAVHAHLNQKNMFEFRPSGLSYFAELNEAYKKLEDLLANEISSREKKADLTALFDGESIIKTMIGELSAKSSPDAFSELRNFTEEHKTERKQLEAQKAELIALKKDKEINDLLQQRQQLDNLKKRLETTNRYFSAEQLEKALDKIIDCVNKERLAATNNIEQFQVGHLEGIGTPAWREFVLAADNFAKFQDEDGKKLYPSMEDACLLCHQPLSSEAQHLVASYRTFIKSKAEQDSKDAKAGLEQSRVAIEKLDLNLLPDTSTLHKWLIENRPEDLHSLKQIISAFNILKNALLDSIVTKSDVKLVAIQADLNIIDGLTSLIDIKVADLNASDITRQIDTIQRKIVVINHREKLNDHFATVEQRIKDLDWVAKAQKGKAKINKRELTNKEKELSETYFNQAYVNKFNQECKRLNGNFGINISHSGSSGTSYRQLKLKGKQPTDVLSEGEQKVISLADFLSETILSGVNRGMIFDDPVTSLDEERKAQIAERLVDESTERQIIVFTHDLVFVSQLISLCKDSGKTHECHWIEQRNGKPGYISLKNAPSYEKAYKTAEKPNNLYLEARKDSCQATMREMLIQQAFTALRTCYETLVVFGLFQGVVQRFEERVSVDSLTSVHVDQQLKNELLESFWQCCRYMEGHSHSDKYAYKKPKIEDLEAEIKRYDEIRLKIAAYNKAAKK